MVTDAYFEMELAHDGPDTFATDDAANSFFANVLAPSPDVGASGLDVEAVGSGGNPSWYVRPAGNVLADGDVITGFTLTVVLPNTGAAVTGGEFYEISVTATGFKQFTVVSLRPPAAVPALPGWALAALALVIGLLGFVSLRTRGAPPGSRPGF